VPDAGAIVVKQEDVARKGGEIRILHHPGDAHVRQRGSHKRAAELLVASGCRLTPGMLALLAEAGVARPLVSQMPRVAHVATGGELVDCGDVPEPGQIRDSNSPLLAALVHAHGAELVQHRRVDESPGNLGQALDAALAARPDILLVSGGASVGDHDHTRACLLAAGFELLVQGVNNRPGKPMIVGQRGTTLAFGLPGNPLSHFVCFHLFVRRALERLSGLPATLPVRLPVQGGAELTANARESWWPCHVGLATDGPAGTLCARPLPWRDSSDITALADAGGLLRVPPQGLPAGALADVLLMNSTP
jgi:molybdopterin molybdotransferase